MNRSAYWCFAALLLTAPANAQAVPAGESKLPAAWSPRAAYALAVLQDMARELDARQAAGRALRASWLDQGELWFCGYQAQLVQSTGEDAAPTAVIWPREPSAPHWGLYALPAEPAPTPECVFFLAPGRPLLWSENRATNYHAGAIPVPSAALGRGGNRAWSARQRSAGTGEDGELWQLATMPRRPGRVRLLRRTGWRRADPDGCRRRCRRRLHRATGAVGEVRPGAARAAELWGYRFQMFLRGTDGEWVTEHADGDGARGVEVDPDDAERSWCCLAWPVRAGWTGQPVYFVDQSGEVLAFANTDGAFSGGAAPKPWTSPQPPAGWTIASPSGIPRDGK